ncbi:protein kinase, partial [Pleurocapsales cyanobacterium LEGE 10410]|nr:protein kinase [Pleurocapsales cyanobacterium LEGE 10410]
MQGTIIGSRYRVIRYIAKGGFGKTFLAEDIQLPAKDKCVVKQLYPSIDEPDFVKIARRLFKTEAETLYNLGNHDQIPQLLAYFEEDEKFYLVQQYIEGHTLSEELADIPWSEDRAIALLKDCLGILDFVHGKGVIHRDIKPDNLIRRSCDRKLVLVDFGTVKEIIAEQTRLVPTTVAVGTKGYMPCEQARGKPRTTSDLYALGIMAIEALTGIDPIELEENDHGEIIWQDLAQCSLQLKIIISKMTRYHFQERYQSAREILAALADLNDRQTAIAQTGVRHTPTTELSGSQLVNRTGNPQSNLTESQAVANNASRLTLNNPAASSNVSLANNTQPQLKSPRSKLVEKESNSTSQKPKSGKTLITLGVALTVGAIASGGMYLLEQQNAKTGRQASLAQQINHFNQMVERQDYQACYEAAIELKAEAAQVDQAKIMPLEQQQEFQAQCGLALAREAGENLEYSQAVAIAETLPPGTSVDTEIAQQLESWSEQLLQEATRLYKQEGKLEQALEIVKQIPQNIAVQLQVSDAKNSWQAEHQNNQATITLAQQALSEEQWLNAKQEATKVKNSASMYWQEQARAVINQAEEGIAASTPVAEPEEASVEENTTAPVAEPEEASVEENTTTPVAEPEQPVEENT